MSTVQVITMDWADLRARWLEAYATKQWRSQPTMGNLIAGDWSDVKGSGRWSAPATGADTKRWIETGYYAEGFTLNPVETKPHKRRRACWSEDDGEPDIGRLYGGSDEYLLHSAKRDSIPGLELEIEYGFSGSTPPDAITEYGAWLTKLISALEGNGYDLAVTIIVRCTALFRGQDPMTRTDLRIIVKRAGELSDFTSWSALFSPNGFRHLVFCSMGIAGDAIGRQCARGLGGPVTSGWSIKRDDNLITIGCDSRGESGVPIEQLNNEAREAGLIQ